MRSIGTSQFGWPVGSLPPSDTINSMVFSGASAITQAIPANAGFVLVSASQNVDIMVIFGGIPGGAVANTVATTFANAANSASGNASELNPLLRQLSGATTISVAANAACTVTLAYYN